MITEEQLVKREYQSLFTEEYESVNQEVMKGWNSWKYFLGESDVQGEPRLAGGAGKERQQ